MLEMDGHGIYVWGSFVMVAAAAAWETLMLVQRRRRALEDLHDRQRLQAGTAQSVGSHEHVA
jgi:heme exporter protein CcmD